ncbi:MAG: hypothetical protein VYE73_04560 [Acidobacteriota bacterium]|nr:hypothetical protein [Acidobacteriota bacterium]
MATGKRCSSETEFAIAAVMCVLQGHANRGVFRGFSVREVARGRHFEFRWLTDATFHLRLDALAGTLTFSDLLPNVPYRSAMDRAFRSFVRECTSEQLPAHRRIDRDLAQVRCRNRKGSASLVVTAVGGDFDYATRKAISLVNEIFHGFLRGPYYAYMVENFNEPEE